ncbi:MAG: hypothetical protein LBD07_02785 [Spirochaetaceae bacterium]|nr:hypothetical protein [Spirochaetaceae bacterium]
MINIVIGNNDDTVRPKRVPDCLKCDYFKVSWDNSFPRSCSIFEIKSKTMPSADVLSATGLHCPAFKLKKTLK